MSETYIDTIIDENGNEMHPVTETKAVHLPEGRRLQDVMICKGDRPLDPSVPVSPIDADMLGGHEVEYFATAEMLTDEITRAKAAESAINNSLNKKTEFVKEHNYSSIPEALSAITARLEPVTPSVVEFLVNGHYFGIVSTYQKSSTPNYASALIVYYNGDVYKCACLNGTWTITKM